ncbi:helix-turn-helix domain-containing protein [Microbacterium halotolerans]|uniref:helix-turn-helix domain-containing protein n=1 Tax=Microbacterium halotolerans TaxID=246613 RepID=UPI0013C32F2E|nr:AraC family transcriptional regulator [Microbacterium halotolerans]
MTTTEQTPLERMLAALEWRVLEGRRTSLAPGERLRFRAGVAALAFVAQGRLIRTAESGCGELLAGAAVVSMGRAPVMLSAGEAAEVMSVELELTPGTSSMLERVPNMLSVARFAEEEPTMAAIARDIGKPGCEERHGTMGTICALMATTVVLAAIRMWAEAGCVPEGWPARSADPFLSRVLDAIHDDPGRAWSVAQLAEIGAMSRTVFADRFRAATGCTPAAYLGAVRIDTAKSLLAEGASVSETARRLGFASDEGFSRAFRRRTGLPPSQWRYRRDLPASENSTPPTAVQIAAIA